MRYGPRERSRERLAVCSNLSDSRAGPSGHPWRSAGRQLLHLAQMDLFRFDPPDPPEAEVCRIAHELYGLTGTTTRLRGERSHNTCFTTPAGDQFVLRIASASEPAALIECHAQALVHIERVDPALPIARMMVARNDRLVPTIQLAGRPHRVR